MNAQTKALLPPADVRSLLGESAPMRALRQALQALLDAADDAAPALLLLGEPGTGRQNVARLLHAGSARREQPFVALSCALLPPARLEEELFGRERDAFIAARRGRPGLVESAHGGTLYLDDIDAADAALQARLFELLDRQAVRRVGGLRAHRVDVRLVAAASRPLQPLVAEQRWRADLCTRLARNTLTLPALRERSDDIGQLARHFVARHAGRRGVPAPGLSAAALAELARRAWPGNLCELRDVLGHALANARGRESIEPEDLAPQAGEGLAAEPEAPFELNLHKVERATLLRALQRAGWNVTRAARLLGITRDTLRYRIDKHGLAMDMPGFGAARHAAHKAPR